mmetsp:Transcript_20413/g.57001  ORF Transcript_20413/g.57001 Transcript_20413/m.57001 type:complete len:200 (-) Transcript_20413:1101-1700(-)
MADVEPEDLSEPIAEPMGPASRDPPTLGRSPCCKICGFHNCDMPPPIAASSKPGAARPNSPRAARPPKPPLPKGYAEGPSWPPPPSPALLVGEGAFTAMESAFCFTGATLTAASNATLTTSGGARSGMGPDGGLFAGGASCAASCVCNFTGGAFPGAFKRASGGAFASGLPRATGAAPMAPKAAGGAFAGGAIDDKLSS